VTLPAVDTFAVRGVEGNPYKVGPYCSNPTCKRGAEHAHHIVRRSRIGGPFDWVEIDGRLYGNLTGLCVPCHDDVTGVEGGHKAGIRLIDGEWIWCLAIDRDDPRTVGDEAFATTTVFQDSRGNTYFPIGPLSPQPPTPETLAELASGATEESEHACPFCGQAKRRRRLVTGPGRRRRSWIVRVPDDDLENGADVLDVLIEDLAMVLNVEPNTTGRYFVIVPALYHAIQDKKAFAESLEGIGG
jgi:hypothetical protein